MMYVYVAASRARVLYVGVTNDLRRRMYEHRHHVLPGFTARYRVEMLVYFEATSDPRVAIVREKQIKGWARGKKLRLIESMNPDWQDLAAEWFTDRACLPG